ncbi:MAG: hypothetical protein ABIP95_02245 [Pelobium sp.]
MKKLLIVLFAVATVAATSCKKEAEVAPVKSLKVVSDKGDVGTWD